MTVNVFWCPQCDEGYQAVEPGCLKCAEKAKTAVEPVAESAAGSDSNAHLACGAIVVIAVLFGGSGLVLGFFIWG